MGQVTTATVSHASASAVVVLASTRSSVGGHTITMQGSFYQLEIIWQNDKRKSTKNLSLKKSTYKLESTKTATKRDTDDKTTRNNNSTIRSARAQDTGERQQKHGDHSFVRLENYNSHFFNPPSDR